MIPKFKMLVGLPASGKSYFAKTLEDTIIYSSDALRIELFGDVDEQDKNNILFSELHKRIKADLSAGKNVCYDATNLSHKKRINFLKEINYIECEKICYVMATPYELCLAQNELRSKKVDEKVIERMYKNITIPQYYEGWDMIFIHFHPLAEVSYEHWSSFKSRLDITEQDNPHHTKTIGLHMDACAENFDAMDLDNMYRHENRLISLACKLHDIGKEFCQFYKEEKGHSVYYQHHLVGAYMAMFLLKYDFGWGNNDIITMCNYIQWHMQPFFMKTEKAHAKFIKLVGYDTYDVILRINEADKGAK